MWNPDTDNPPPVNTTLVVPYGNLYVPAGAGELRVLWVPCWSRGHLQGSQRVLDSFGSQEGLLESCAELFMSAFGESDLSCLHLASAQGTVGSDRKMKCFDWHRAETHNFP